jgi:hypothetical protein
MFSLIPAIIKASRSGKSCVQTNQGHKEGVAAAGLQGNIIIQTYWGNSILGRRQISSFPISSPLNAIFFSGKEFPIEASLSYIILCRQ